MAHKSKKPKPTPEELPLVHPHAAGIDVGAEEHWVCVPADRDVEAIQKVSAFTCDLYRLADWLTTCRITTVGMDSTGEDGRPRIPSLQARGCDGGLVAARRGNDAP